MKPRDRGFVQVSPPDRAAATVASVAAVEPGQAYPVIRALLWSLTRSQPKENVSWVGYQVAGARWQVLDDRYREIFV